MRTRIPQSRAILILLLTVLVAGSAVWLAASSRGQAAGDPAAAEGRRLIEAVVRTVHTTYIDRNVDDGKLYRGAGKAVLEAAGKPCAQSVNGSAATGTAPELYALIDRIRERCSGAPDVERLYLAGARGLLDALGDPYTRLMEPSAFKEFMQETRGFFFGIGIYIDLRDNHLIVVQPIADTPAARAGLRAGDRILRINGTSTQGMALQEAVSRIRGPEGSTVRLAVARADREFEVNIVRAKISFVAAQGPNQLDEASRAALRAAGIGYINLVTFNHERAAAIFDQELARIRRERARALILDLRNNGGGLLDQSLEIADRFLPRGATILRMFDRNGREETSRARSRDQLTIPVIVLVNEFSASASEIVAGALQDNHAATIVGVHTFGKNLVQNIVGLPPNGLPMGAGLAISTSKWLTPAGRDINKKGLAPDVAVGESEEALRERLKGRPDAEIEQRVQRMHLEQLQRAIGILKQRLQRSQHLQAAA
jgi:carboxyl-terminal processing protease